MEKLDFKKELREFYQPSAQDVQIVTVPPLNYLMIDGAGDPNTSREYREAIETLFGLAYAIKFKIKKGSRERAAGIDYGVMPLESLWWTDNPAEFSMDHKENWKWTALLMQPEPVTPAVYEEALAEVKGKKDLPAIGKVRFESYAEGLSAQIMHLGPYAAEGPTVAKLHGFITGNGYACAGKHHEIYLSDVRKCAPDKLKTVIRQPVDKG